MSEIELKFKKFFATCVESKFIKKEKFNAKRENLGKRVENFSKNAEIWVKIRLILKK